MVGKSLSHCTVDLKLDQGDIGIVYQVKDTNPKRAILKRTILTATTALCFFFGSHAQVATTCEDAPDVIYHNGIIITMNAQNPVAEAFAVKSDTLVAVGANEDILALAGQGCSTPTADLQGLTVLPGFIESHAHWFSWSEHICSVTEETTHPSLDEIMAMLSSNGWTSFAELNFGRPDFVPDHFDNAMDLDSRGELSVRVSGYWGTYDDVSMIDVLKDAGRTPDAQYSSRIRAPGVKIYVDDPFGTVDILSQDEVDQLVMKAHNAGWQVAAHAVNESAVEKILTAYEKALGADSNAERRHRIEHAVKVSDDQLQRMKARGIIASFQLLGPPDWPAQSDFDDRFLGSNPEWVLRWSDFIIAEDAGAQNTGSSDSPFNDAPCDPSPFRLIYQAVTRDGYVDREPADWELDQRLTVEDAISLLTIDGAYASFDEDRKGSLEAGKWADFVVVSENPLEVASPEALLDIDVHLTAVGGTIEYCNLETMADVCAPGDAFVTEQGVVRASNYVVDQTPDRAFDGDTNTNWGAGTEPPQWIEITTRDGMRIGGIDLVVEQFPAGRTVHEIWARSRDEGDDLELLHQFAGETASDQVLSYTAPGNVKDYDVFRIVTTESPSWVAWREIMLKPFSATAAQSEVPRETTLRATIQHYPNPVHSEATIRYEIPGVEPGFQESAEIALFDVFGRPIRNWPLSLSSNSTGHVLWDARDRFGRSVANGVYVYRLIWRGHSWVNRLVVTK